MNYYRPTGQMDLSDRIAIETGLCRGESFKRIARRLKRHPSTIACTATFLLHISHFLPKINDSVKNRHNKIDEFAGF